MRTVVIAVAVFSWVLMGAASSNLLLRQGASAGTRVEYLIDARVLRDGRNINRCKRDSVELSGKTYSRSISPPVYGSRLVECVVFQLPADAVSIEATFGVVGSLANSKTARLSFKALRGEQWEQLGAGSGTLKRGAPAEKFTADVRGCTEIAIYSTGSGYRAPGTFWVGDPRIVCGAAAP